MKVCITGGHLTPALATIDECDYGILIGSFLDREKQSSCRRYRRVSGICHGKESRDTVLPVVCREDQSDGFHRDFFVSTVYSFGFIQAFLLCMKETPYLLSFHLAGIFFAGGGGRVDIWYSDCVS